MSITAIDLTKREYLERIIDRLPPGRARRRYERLLDGGFSTGQEGVLCNRPPSRDLGPMDTAPPETVQAKPFVDRYGELIIPSSASEKYRWWVGGQGIRQTLAELGASEEVIKKYRNRTDH